MRSNPGESTYQRYGGSNSESSARTWKPNGEVRGSNLKGGWAAGSSGTGSVSHVVKCDISRENVQKRINRRVVKAFNKEARYYRG